MSTPKAAAQIEIEIEKTKLEQYAHSVIEQFGRYSVEHEALFDENEDDADILVRKIVNDVDNATGSSMQREMMEQLVDDCKEMLMVELHRAWLSGRSNK